MIDRIGKILPGWRPALHLAPGHHALGPRSDVAAPAASAATGSDGKVRAAMNGRVVAVLVRPGERVAAGQPVMTLEAMKMEHVHTASISGTISAIDVAEGEQVTTGKIVVEIEAETRSGVSGRRPGVSRNVFKRAMDARRPGSDPVHDG